MNREYEQLLKELNNTDPKDKNRIKKIHRELKKFDDGVPFLAIYQNRIVAAILILVGIWLIRTIL